MNEKVFDGVSEIYAKHRPSYPKPLFNYLCSKIGLNEKSVIADIGSGTGILTLQLLRYCKYVYAVEPNIDMRNTAEKLLNGTTGFISVEGTAEKTTLESHSVDFITAAQAFHWFDRNVFKKECSRILKPGGKVVLIWNARDETSEIVRDIDLINQKFCPEFTGSSAGFRGEKCANDFANFFRGNYEKMVFRNNISFDENKFIGLHLSASYRLKKEDRNYLNYITELSKYFRENSQNGKLTIQNLTLSYVGVV